MPNDIPNETLDRLIAERVCGWKIEPSKVAGVLAFQHPDEWRMYIHPMEGHRRRNGQWSPSNDLNQCREAELKLEQSHGISYYKWLDAYTLRPEWDKRDLLPWGYCIFRADARTRCIAMLAVLGVNLEEENA